MFARVTVIEGPPDRVAEGVRYIQEQVVPVAKTQRGIKAGYWLVDRGSGKGLAITLWESEGALRASEPAVAKLREEAVAASGAKLLSVDVYEVVDQL